MPAVSASPRGRRVAAWRSIRAPRRLSRIGPLVRAPVARSIARPTAGGSGTKTTLLPLPHTQHPVTVLLAEIGDVRAGGLEDPQAEQPEHGHEREVAAFGGPAGGGEQGL